jgi:hypothetical protein
MARAIADAEATGGAPVNARFTGASADSLNLRALLVSVVDDFAAHGTAEKPTEFEQDANKFKPRLRCCSRRQARRRSYSSTHLTNCPHDLGWLPANTGVS